MFHPCGLPSMSLQASEFKVWDEQGKPNPLPTGVQATFGGRHAAPAASTTRRALEVDLEGRPEGREPDTVKEVTLMACNAEGDASEWMLTNALPVVATRPRAWRPPARTC